MELVQPETTTDTQEVKETPVIPDDLQLSTIFTVLHCGLNSRIYINETATFGMIANPAEQLALVDAVAGLLGNIRQGVLKKMQNAKV